ncbi:MAG: ribulose-phosphate 3-epimerase [Candidatus Yanofskybacteria bacterium]|nr:ribulose-phosphate 3-epimerase [Candidatus Yanofskybacteria bacterium]
MVQIIPAILTNDPDEFERVVQLVEPHTTRAHLDIADGIFVPNETIKGYAEIERETSNLRYDVHLMVKDPLEQLSHWETEKADRFIIHAESDNVISAINLLRQKKKGVGLALNPGTLVTEAERYMRYVDFVQFMTVNPGFQGTEFLDHVVEKIDDFHKNYPASVIAVDGGISPATAKKVIQAGASVLVSGSLILKSGNVGKRIEELKKIGENKV